MIPLGSLGGFHVTRMNCPNGCNLTSDGGPGSKNAEESQCWFRVLKRLW